jgi:murein DD-endopeptidase MepM/ murein hydrolase activator NlpD
MKPPTGNRITQTQHLASKAVDYAAGPDPYVYAPEDGTIDSFMQRGTPGTTSDAGLCLRMNGKTGLHQFGHLERSYVQPGQKVKKGLKIAKMGYTGYTQPDNIPAGAHLHYWVLTPTGYVYPPNLYTEAFNKEEDMAELFKGHTAEYWYIRARDAEKALKESQVQAEGRRVRIINAHNALKVDKDAKL